jgi:general secretion pathway protein I
MMVALAILATGYVALIEAQASAIRSSTYGKQMTIATFLAQAKLEEIEEKLTREGFPDMDDKDDGNFEEQGFPSFRWALEVNKVELPVAELLDQLLTSLGGGEGKDGEGGLPGGLGLPGGGKSGEATGGGGLSGMLNPDMLRGSVEMLGTMLEQALREVRVTVQFGERPDDQVALTTHLVQVPQAPAGAGGGIMPGGGLAPGGGVLPGGLDPGGLNLPRPGSPGGSGGKPGAGGMGAGRSPIQK